MTTRSTADRRLRALDLFCGAGGSSWGAQAAGVQIVAAFDRWPLAGANYQVNFPRTTFYEGNLEDRNVKELARELGPIDLILASPECTNHSAAKGGKPRCEQSKDTAFQVIRFAEVFKPRWIVVENVVNMQSWTRYQEFKRELEKELKYHVLEQKLNSADFGVPQTRRRLFLLCDRKKAPGPVPGLDCAPRQISSVLDLNGAYRYSPLRTDRRAQATLDRADRGIEGVGPHQPFLMVYYGSDHAGGWQHLNRPLRTITTLDRFALVKPSAKGHEMRMLQVPELQAAMGMEDMNFPQGTRRDRIKMIGNAVCPPVMKQVVKRLVFDTH